MAKTAEKTAEKPEAPEAAVEETTEAAAAPAAATPAPQQQMVQVQVNDADAIALYANFCRVTGSPEALISDFGLNPQPVGVPKEPSQVKQRIIGNYFTAKRLVAAVNMSVQRH